MDLNADYDLQAEQIMAKTLMKDSSCIDIGSHAGSFVDLFLKYAPQGQHFAFEPLPDLCRGLRAKYSKNSNVAVVEAALSDADGTASFTHVVSNPGYSGLRERRYDRPTEELRKIVVPVRRLDDVVPNTIRVRLIKIDVEGAELQVLRGAKETLRRSRPVVIFEHGLGAADCYGTTPADVYGLLCTELGLGIHLMERWLMNSDEPALSCDEFHDEFASGRNFYFMAISEELPSRPSSGS